MAPIRPKATAHHRARLARIADPTIRPKAHRPDAVVTDEFISSKRDRRQIKHSSFISKIKSSKPSSGVKKRRRPGKKLVADLGSLADALEEVEGEEEGDRVQEGKVRLKSLKHKPGALKRREKLVREEVGRFRGVSAHLAGVKEDVVPAEGMEVDGEKKGGQQGDGAAKMTTTNRWALLRGSIASSLEQADAFRKKG